ncbi:dolichol-phosphate mannosyltransferase subunit 3 isoform X1 [Lepidochelys kempii]|uniref:dolichol-phosphate mannosyltransferase subunit 3 isoform X1 n=2 Tax=Cheloniidae TaxID=8465 RepID=UPI003C7057FA
MERADLPVGSLQHLPSFPARSSVGLPRTLHPYLELLAKADRSGHQPVLRRDPATRTMTKLVQWLCGLALLGTAWATLALDPLGLHLPLPCQQVLWPFPVYLLVAFGCYSLATVGYRLATFNDCEAAAKELQEQIREARADLSRRGLKF